MLYFLMENQVQEGHEQSQDFLLGRANDLTVKKQLVTRILKVLDVCATFIMYSTPFIECICVIFCQHAKVQCFIVSVFTDYGNGFYAMNITYTCQTQPINFPLFVHAHTYYYYYYYFFVMSKMDIYNRPCLIWYTMHFGLVRFVWLFFGSCKGLFSTTSKINFCISVAIIQYMGNLLKESILLKALA